MASKLKNRTKRVVAYARVSTGNKEQKQSFEAQQEYYLEKFKNEGYTIAPTGLLHRKNGNDEVIEGIYADEGISATSTRHRVAFLQMIEDAKRGLFDMIFVKSTSRFARNTEDGLHYCEELRKCGVAVMFEDYNVCSISEDKDFELALFFSLAQKESQTKSYNVKWGIRQSQKNGTWFTKPSFGYEKSEEYGFVINEAEAEIVKKIFSLYLDDEWGTAKIASYLQAEGVPTKRAGKTWRMNTIRGILKNPIYKGELRAHVKENRTIKNKADKIDVPEEEQIVIPREDLRIISDEVWEKARVQREKRAFKMANGEKPSGRYKFSAFLYCECGGSYRAKPVWRHKQKPKKYAELGYMPMTYVCTTRDAYRKSVLCSCPKTINIREEKIEAVVSKHIKTLQNSRDFLDELFGINEMVVRGLPKNDEEMKALYDKRDEINTEIRGILKRIALSDTSLYDELLDELEEELKAVNSEIGKSETRERAIKIDGERYKEYLDRLAKVDADHFTREDMLYLFDRVEVRAVDRLMPDYRGGNTTGTALIFNYNFLDMPVMELIKKAFSMGFRTDTDMYEVAGIEVIE